MKPKLESAYICVEDMERAVGFYQWFLDRKGINKDDKLYNYLFFRDYLRENEECANKYKHLKKEPILDLCIIMPAFIINAILTIRNKGLGLLFTPALFI